MLDTANKWELFGFDVRRIGKHWLAAWREFLWGYDSPVKARLDEVVRVRSGGDLLCYHAGRPVPSRGETACEAVLLPDDLVLSRTLSLPLAAETDLDAVMALEVGAHSPFPADDTGSGWKVASRGESALTVQLAIVSLSAVMGYLGREYDCHDPKVFEVWAGIDGSPVVIGGFGEGRRRDRYRRRLIRVGALAGCAALAVLLMFGLAAGFKYLELQAVQGMAAGAERDAAGASDLRAELAAAAGIVATADRYLLQHPNPHLELARLTRLLGDEAYVQQFAMNGREIRIRGQAVNAAEVMSQLTAEPAYAEVTVPQAITKLGNTGLERFVFNIRLAGGES